MSQSDSQGGRTPQRRLFDSHCHIIDHRFPIIANQGYLPPGFPLAAYLAETRPLGVVGGAVVSGSFQGNDQTYLQDLLPRLGAGWAAVTQIPGDYPDAAIEELGKLGVRALRFNMFRGRIDSVDEILSLAARCHAIAGWHAEIYADAAALGPHAAKLSTLPQLCIDHLGMTEAGLPVLLDLVAGGCKVKATGFGRVQMDVPKALERIARASPHALVFGTTFRRPGRSGRSPRRTSIWWKPCSVVTSPARRSGTTRSPCTGSSRKAHSVRAIPIR